MKPRSASTCRKSDLYALMRTPLACRTGLVDLGCVQFAGNRRRQALAQVGITRAAQIALEQHDGGPAVVELDREAAAALFRGDASAVPVDDAIRRSTHGGPEAVGRCLAPRVEPGARRCAKHRVLRIEDLNEFRIVDGGDAPGA